MVEKEGRECLLIPGDLMDNETCRKAVEKHVEKFGKIHVLVYVLHPPAVSQRC
jgi:NAD(P)-dependent dehydrogenase (short-subunit alcohol dehydrogenase family)